MVLTKFKPGVKISLPGSSKYFQKGGGGELDWCINFLFCWTKEEIPTTSDKGTEFPKFSIYHLKYQNSLNDTINCVMKEVSSGDKLCWTNYVGDWVPQVGQTMTLRSP